MASEAVVGSMLCSGTCGADGFSCCIFLLMIVSSIGSSSSALTCAVVGHSTRMWVAVHRAAEQRGQVGVLFSSLCLVCLFFFLRSVSVFFAVLWYSSHSAFVSCFGVVLGLVASFFVCLFCVEVCRGFWRCGGRRRLCFVAGGRG